MTVPEIQFRTPTLINAENIDALRKCTFAPDQQAEWEPGCQVWYVEMSGNNGAGHMTIWPNGRAAVAHGADSQWGDWNEDEQVLYADDGEIYDVDGDRITEEV